MQELLNNELFWVLIPNLILWLYLWIVPPVVIRVNRIRYFGLKVSGLNILNFIVITEPGDNPYVIRHEYEHLLQQRRFSPLGLAIIILFHYGYLYLRYRSFGEVYRRSWIEQQANRMMYNTESLPKRMIRLNKG